ncbi:heavy-metal-associated domain-containing protein [Ruicaihuangia caeni]|uniref:Heavy metal-associated domain-containing protein n=1 Tax=Ruicaihuangia caeni TaxID=3042517 RepID=A0AAW6TAH9_9MICO|nr:heavy metal-associated domain-containing protein [Klugiella sp. YN-L-19]MDI2099070.1 heavy metal-associated domain-containing protein [Klugiella sp. YN-L-19]
MQELNLTDKNASTGGCGCGGCGCGGCGCGGGNAAQNSQAAVDAETVTELSVTGMTCGHCVNSVTEELSGLAGVSAVEVELVAGGTSKVTVRSDAPLRNDDVRAAIDEAGYALA